MSKRFYFDEFSEDIFDDEIQQYPSNQTICNILSQQQERIADLEAKLAEKETELKQEKEYSKMCFYWKEIYYKGLQELKQQFAEKDKAFDLMSIVLCTGARDDLKRQLGKFAWRDDVKKFFLKQAKKELKNGEKH